jgi:citrate synthase
MTETATLRYNGTSIDLPVVVGTQNEKAIDIRDLRSKSGLITLDDGYGNTGSCSSAITYVNGEKGILKYRGYLIESLATKASFIETAYLLIFGDLPTQSQLTEFRALLTRHEFIHEDMRHHFDGFPPNAPPMAILSAMINAVGCFQPVFMQPEDDEHFLEPAARLMSKIRTIAAASFRKSIGAPMIYPRSKLRYTENLLHMMFSKPYEPYEADETVVSALDRLLILHADHEQNCSTSTVRMVASSQANLYASVAAGVCALWGPLHGGANVAAVNMLDELVTTGEKLEKFIDRVKDKKSNIRLMGFGHRVYKNFDPRATIIKNACHRMLEKLGKTDPLLDLALRLEEIALKDPFFIERKLYPNVDYYSGIILRAIGIPTDMFTVMFAIGRLPGWIAHWREVHTSVSARIDRPRQIYTGPAIREYVPIAERG